MRILVISTQYGKAGYGAYCKEVAELLSDRGHVLTVLTCEDQPDSPTKKVAIQRELKRDPNWDSVFPGALQYFVFRSRRKDHNTSVYNSTYKRFQPDVISVWQGTGLSPEILLSAEGSPTPVVYSIDDYWPEHVNEYAEYWARPAIRTISRFLKNILKSYALSGKSDDAYKKRIKFTNLISVSAAVYEHLYDYGIRPKKSEVIHNGINLEDFGGTPRSRRLAETELSLLYGGALLPHKGVHIAIEAMSLLNQHREKPSFSLSIYGKGPNHYLSHLNQLVHEHNLTSVVKFCGWLKRSKFQEVLFHHDILLFTSLYEEPLARIMQEAMAAGLVIVGTNTGGSKELLKDEFNGLVFEPGNAQALARQIRRATHPNLFEALSRNGIQYAKANCDINVSVERIETFLSQILSKHSQI